MASRLPVLPLLAGMFVVPSALTALGFAVYGDEITAAMPFPAHRVRPPTRPPFPSRPTPEPVAVPTPETLRQDVASLFSGNGVKGITFAPGGTEFVGRGEAVQVGVGDLLRDVRGAVVTLVAHAWNGETATHRCDVLAMRRALLVRDFLVSRGVPEESIRVGVVVDPVWGPPTDGGPQVDVLVG
jgi:outer membrane protein OmpA-like peptidoglycan-associated protein